MQHHALFLVAVLALVSACLPGVDLPPPHGLTGGEFLSVARDTPMQQIMGGGLGEVDHVPLTAGRPGSVLPAGARVQVTEDYVERRRNLAPNASQVDRNPWIFVRVLESPVPAQEGWQGWIHLDATARGDRVVPASIGEPLLSRASRLCPYADSPDMACSLAIDPDALIRVRGCAGDRVHAEMWSATGLYVNGFIGAQQFKNHPCRAAAKE